MTIDSHKPEERLKVLDGLRGLMAILVVTHHFNLANLVNTSHPITFKWFFWLFSSQGSLAVYFFFSLAGFLMTHLYHRIDNLKIFYLKRFTRILPLYWSLAFIYTLYEFYQPPILLLIFEWVITMILMNFYWEMVLFTNRISSQNKIILFIWPFILSSIIYLWFLRMPVEVLRSTPDIFQILLTFFVNATITFGLGNYIPIVGLIFWSMGLELFFYLLYPYINYVFLVDLYSSSIKRIGAFFILLGLLYLLMLYFSNKIFQINFFYPETSIFFCVGIFWGLIYKKSIYKRVTQLFWRFEFQIIIVIFLVLVLISNVYYSVFGLGYLNNSVKIIVTLPLVFMCFGLILSSEEKKLGKFFLSQPLILLGTISYSLYLSHGLVVSSIGGVTSNDSMLEVILRVFGLVLLSIFFAYLCYLFIERRYFLYYRVLIENLSSEALPVLSRKKLIVIGFLICQLIFIFASRPTYGLTSYERNIELTHSNSKTKLSNLIPINFSFKSTDNGMAIVFIKILNDAKLLSFNEMTQATDSAKLKITFYDNDRKLIKDHFIDIWRVRKEEWIPIGLPVQVDSSNKNYQIDLQLTPGKLADQVFLSNSNYLKIIYKVPKKNILNNPLILISLILEKTSMMIKDSKLILASIVNLIIWLLIFKMNIKQDAVGFRKRV